MFARINVKLYTKKDGWKVSRNFLFSFFPLLGLHPCFDLIFRMTRRMDVCFFFFPKTVFFILWFIFFFFLSRIKYIPVSWRVCFSPRVCVCTWNSTSRFFLFWIDWTDICVCEYGQSRRFIYSFNSCFFVCQTTKSSSIYERCHRHELHHEQQWRINQHIILMVQAMPMIWMIQVLHLST